MLYYTILFVVLIDIISEDNIIWFLIGLWFFLTGILIKTNKKKLLKVILADFALKGDYDVKKALFSGGLSILLGVLIGYSADKIIYSIFIIIIAIIIIRNLYYRRVNRQ